LRRARIGSEDLKVSMDCEIQDNVDIKEQLFKKGAKTSCLLINSEKFGRDVAQEPMVTEGLDSTGEEAKEEATERRVFTNTDGPT